MIPALARIIGTDRASDHDVYCQISHTMMPNHQRIKSTVNTTDVVATVREFRGEFWVELITKVWL
jgi:hypothetical protein